MFHCDVFMVLLINNSIFPLGYGAVFCIDLGFPLEAVVGGKNKYI